MAWIPYVEPKDAGGVLAKLYDSYGDENGDVDNILRIHGLNPPSLSGHVGLYQTLMQQLVVKLLLQIPLVH